MRLGIISGGGVPIQTGGNKVGDSVQFGLNMTKLICGSQYSLGCLYEALIKT